MSYPYGYPPPYAPPPYYQPAPQQSPSDIIRLAKDYKDFGKALEELAKKPPEQKKEKSYNQKQLLMWMAIMALPVGFATWSIILLVVASNLRALGLIP